jgi:hypothetical protein
VADRVKAIKSAIEKKNRFYHDMIYRGIVLSPQPHWANELVPDLEAKKQALMAERMAKMPALDQEVEQSLQIQPHLVELIPVK